MSNTIRIKKRAASGSAGSPSSLSPSELAFNENDLKLYYGFGDDGNTPPAASSIITIGGAGAFFNKTDTRSANAILAGPTTGSAAAPTFRSLVAADIPSIAHTKISDFDTGVRTNRVDQLASATNPVTGVTPTSDNHFATKSYVDGVSQGLDVKEAVKVATTANITLSGTQTIDGVAVSADERVLVKSQSTASQNGLYLCKSGSWARTDDLAAGSDASSVFVFVDQGTVNSENGFVCTTSKGSAVTGTNNLSFTQFSGAGQITASDGLSKSGNTLSVDLKSNGGLVIESSEIAVDLAASSITGTLAVSDGGTGATSASAARTSLGLVIGTDVEPHSDKLTELATMAQNTANALADLTNTEVQILDGATVTTAELNILDGVTATASEINILDGVTATASELNIMDGVTATTSELNIMDGVTATTAELNIMDGVTATATELNIMDGNTSATSTTLATADRMVMNDNGTMKQVALSDLVTFLEDGATSGFDINGGTY